MIARIAAAAMAVFMVSPALAQTKPVCGSYVEVTAFLKEKFDQEAVAHGIDNSGNAAQVLVSPGGATWTVIVSIPNGPTCLVAMGKDWVQYERKAPESNS